MTKLEVEKQPFSYLLENLETFNSQVNLSTGAGKEIIFYQNEGERFIDIYKPNVGKINKKLRGEPRDLFYLSSYGNVSGDNNFDYRSGLLFLENGFILPRLQTNKPSLRREDQLNLLSIFYSAYNDLINNKTEIYELIKNIENSDFISEDLFKHIDQREDSSFPRAMRINQVDKFPKLKRSFKLLEELI